MKPQEIMMAVLIILFPFFFGSLIAGCFDPSLDLDKEPIQYETGYFDNLAVDTVVEDTIVLPSELIECFDEACYQEGYALGYEAAWNYYEGRVNDFVQTLPKKHKDLWASWREFKYRED